MSACHRGLFSVYTACFSGVVTSESTEASSLGAHTSGPLRATVVVRKSPRRQRLNAPAFAAGVFLVAWPAAGLIDASLQMQLGNPSGATADTNNHNHYLIQRAVEAIDYSDNLGQPNWASWDLTAVDLGTNSAGAWATDTNLPPNFYRVPSSAYSGSGYDRGHLCPSADRGISAATNELTYLMSNVMPQAGNQNSGVWKQFEDHCRTLATNNYELLITCGPSGFGTNRLSSNTNVSVPSYTWKIVVVVPPGASTATNRISPTNQVIALRIPNLDSAGSNLWQTYRTNVLAIEADTGFTFFNALAPNLARVLRSKVDGQTPPPPGITGFSPASGNVGASVSLAGTNLDFTTNVTFNGVSASFLINSGTNLTATVPAGALSGPITAATLGGTATTPGSFIVGANGVPDLALAVAHIGNFTQGNCGDTYMIIVTNLGTATSSGIVTVSNTLPVGLTAVELTGTGWTGDLSSLSCTRVDGLLPGAAYPPIILRVDVAADAPPCVTNVAMVFGGGDTNGANNHASDPTTINAAAVPAVVTGAASNVDTTTATLSGTVNPNGQPASVRFDYGPTTNYGSTVCFAGNLSGTTPQAASTNLAGLSAGMTYHFRVAATNVLGSAAGLDRAFTTGVPDLAITATHNGDFVQGYTCSYAITVTNLGNGASLGSITVINALPAGLAACGISGDGWATDLGTLTCTRSDSLPAGAAYPVITVSVNVATNASANVTNFVEVSGGCETNLANNTAGDPTTVNVANSGGGTLTLAGWDVSTLSNYGPTSLPPTTNAPNLVWGGLTRGSGVGTNGAAAGRAWGGTIWTNNSAVTAVASNRFFYFSLAATSGYTLSLAAVSRFDYRHSTTGPVNGLLQYQLGSGEFADVAVLTYPSSSSSGASLGPILLSGIPALQNIGAGTNVTFRIINWAGTDSAGTWYIFDKAGSSAPDFAVQGSVSPATVPVPDLTVSLAHAGGFTQGDTGRTCMITVCNRGSAATAGAVSVTDLLPAGLVATALSGSGWIADLGALTCTRSDPLLAGTNYPPIMVTVSVLTNAPASVTNLATVAGGGESNTTNNTASDPIAVLALALIELWRLQWFGITANSGPAADTAVATSDGLPNLLKYALGLPPVVATNDPITGDISSGYLRLTAPRDPQAADVSLCVEVAPSLTAAWTTNGTTVDSSTATLFQGHYNTPVTSSSGGFIRLRVSRP